MRDRYRCTWFFFSFICTNTSWCLFFFGFISMLMSLPPESNANQQAADAHSGNKTKHLSSLITNRCLILVRLSLHTWLIGMKSRGVDFHDFISVCSHWAEYLFLIGQSDSVAVQFFFGEEKLGDEKLGSAVIIKLRSSMWIFFSLVLFCFVF